MERSTRFLQKPGGPDKHRDSASSGVMAGRWRRPKEKGLQEEFVDI